LPSLAELQAQMAHALLEDPDRLPRELFAPGPVPVEAALRVHRNTIFGALSNALALTYPTVVRLVGEAFFDQAVLAYADARPPVEVCLSAYGEDFPAFLQGYAPATGAPCLADVARLDLAIDRAGGAPYVERLIEIDAAVTLSTPVSLAVLELGGPADRIRDALEAGDDDALATLDPTPAPHWFAVWRADAGAAVRPLSPPAGLFLAALLAGRAAGEALVEAAAYAGSDPALSAVQSEVFAAPFVSVLPATQLEPQP
jgi:hypothetical protein